MGTQTYHLHQFVECLITIKRKGETMIRMVKEKERIAKLNFE